MDKNLLLYLTTKLREDFDNCKTLDEMKEFIEEVELFNTPELKEFIENMKADFEIEKDKWETKTGMKCLFDCDIRGAFCYEE